MISKFFNIFKKREKIDPQKYRVYTPPTKYIFCFNDRTIYSGAKYNPHPFSKQVIFPLDVVKNGSFKTRSNSF